RGSPGRKKGGSLGQRGRRPDGDRKRLSFWIDGAPWWPSRWGRSIGCQKCRAQHRHQDVARRVGLTDRRPPPVMAVGKFEDGNQVSGTRDHGAVVSTNVHCSATGV